MNETLQLNWKRSGFFFFPWGGGSLFCFVRAVVFAAAVVVAVWSVFTLVSGWLLTSLFSILEQKVTRSPFSLFQTIHNPATPGLETNEAEGFLFASFSFLVSSWWRCLGIRGDLERKTPRKWTVLCENSRVGPANTVIENQLHWSLSTREEAFLLCTIWRFTVRSSLVCEAPRISKEKQSVQLLFLKTQGSGPLPWAR